MEGCPLPPLHPAHIAVHDPPLHRPLALCTSPLSITNTVSISPPPPGPPAPPPPLSLFRTVRGLTLRLADKELTPAAQGRQAVGVALPLLLEKGE